MLTVHFSSPFEGFLGRPYDSVHAGIYSVEFGAYGVDTLGKFFALHQEKTLGEKSARNLFDYLKKSYYIWKKNGWTLLLKKEPVSSREPQ